MIYEVFASLSDTCGNTELVHVAYVKANTVEEVYKVYPRVDGFLGFHVELVNVDPLPTKALTRDDAARIFKLHR